MITEQTNPPMCSKCGVLPGRKNGTSVRGYQRWSQYCNTCSKAKPRKKDSECHQCGFESVDQCQMCLVDEVTLCQNCNALRLKRKKRELTVDATVGIWDIRL